MVGDSLGGDELNAYDLSSESNHDFLLYTDTHADPVAASPGNLTPAVSAATVSSMAAAVSTDLTLFNSDTLSMIKPYIKDSFVTGELVKARAVFKGATTAADMVFVSDGGRWTWRAAPRSLPPSGRATLVKRSSCDSPTRTSRGDI